MQQSRIMLLVDPQREHAHDDSKQALVRRFRPSAIKEPEELQKHHRAEDRGSQRRERSQEFHLVVVAIEPLFKVPAFFRHRIAHLDDSGTANRIQQVMTGKSGTFPDFMESFRMGEPRLTQFLIKFSTRGGLERERLMHYIR